MDKTVSYRVKGILVALGCSVASAGVGLVSAACMDSIPGGVVAALLLLALYGLFRHLLQELGKWLFHLPVVCILLIFTAHLLAGGEWLGVACAGACSLLAVWWLAALLKEGREDVRRADAWEARCGSPAVLPCPVSTERLVANLRALAAARPDTSSLDKDATRMVCWEDDPDFCVFNTFALLRKRGADAWCAAVTDIKGNRSEPCIPGLAVRRLFIRETGDTVPSIMKEGDTWIDALVFCRNGELRIYPASRADDFMGDWGGSLFSK